VHDRKHLGALVVVFLFFFKIRKQPLDAAFAAEPSLRQIRFDLGVDFSLHEQVFQFAFAFDELDFDARSAETVTAYRLLFAISLSNPGNRLSNSALRSDVMHLVPSVRVKIRPASRKTSK